MVYIIFLLGFSSQRLAVSEIYFLSAPMFLMHSFTLGLVTVLYNFDFEVLVTNLLLKNFNDVYYYR